MKFNLWTKNGALNSKPVFDAFATGAHNLGHTCVYNDTHGDVDVIWSVLWHGRMAPNKEVFERAPKENRVPLFPEVLNVDPLGR